MTGGKPRDSRTEAVQGKTPKFMGQICSAVLFIVVLAVTSLGLGGGLLDSHAVRQHEMHQRELTKAFGYTLTPEIRPNLGDKRRAAVKASLMPLLSTLPVDSHGHLNEATVRYAMHRYFAYQKGWIVKGFEPFRSNNTRLGDAPILKEKLPEYVSNILMSNPSGFLAEDLVMLVAAVEQLIFDEAIESVDMAYHVNSIPMTRKLSKKDMLSVIASFMIENILEGNFSDVEQHLADKAHITEIYPNWDKLQLYLEDIVGKDAWERNVSNSPFARDGKAEYTFEDTSRFATHIVEDFGMWSNYECRHLTETLSLLDPHATGRVRLLDFHRTWSEADWHLSETYLRDLGALDESSDSLGPQVIIPNYVQGMSNCILSSHHYSICCMNECLAMQQKLEEHLQAPKVKPEEVALAMESLFARNVSSGTELRKSLDDAAVQNNGEILLHSRLFLQWLHFVFPRDCPYPHKSGTINPETIEQSSQRIGEQAVKAPGGYKEEKLKHQVPVPPSPDAGKTMWLTHDEHFAVPPVVDETSVWFAALAKAVGGIALAAVILSSIAKAIAHARNSKASKSGSSDKTVV